MFGARGYNMANKTVRISPNMFYHISLFHMYFIHVERRTITGIKCVGLHDNLQIKQQRKATYQPLVLSHVIR